MRLILLVAVLLAILQQATAIMLSSWGMCQSRLRSQPSVMASRWRSPSMETDSSLPSPSLWMWLAPVPPWRRSGSSWGRM